MLNIEQYLSESFLDAFQNPLIIVVEGLSVDIYSTLENAAKNLEGIDVLHNEYEIFDSKGHIVSPFATNNWSPVQLKIDNLPPDPARLKSLLIRSILFTNKEEVNEYTLNNQPLDDLIRNYF